MVVPIMAEPEKKSARSSICLLRWCFGEFPPFMDCILRSCAGNPDIDWLILTDNPSTRNFPPNVRSRRTSLEELRDLFSSKLGFRANIPRRDLLVTFKPAFGFFFEEELRSYDFWGHCDFDMIFGDLRKFLREDILSVHDKILGRGHLTLYRNTPKVNRYFMLEAPGCPNYREAFQNPLVGQFDEWHGIHPILRYHNIPQYLEEIIVDVARPTRWKYTRFEGTAIRNYPLQLFYWYKGKVFQAHPNCDGGTIDDEYAYIHFQKRPLPAPRFNPFETDGFLITPDGFFPYAREDFSEIDYRRYNRTRFRPMGELKEAAWRSLRRRLGLK